MSAGHERTGGCLCGAARFTARLSRPEIGACHCVQCQRWTGGGPYFAVPVDSVTFENADGAATYRASDWGERAFCRTCGSPLYWRMVGREIGNVPAGLLDDQTGLTVAAEIFIDHRPGWLPAWPEATQSTEDEEFAKLREALGGDKP